MDKEAKYWRDKWIESNKIVETLLMVRNIKAFEPKKRRKQNVRSKKF